MFCSYSIARVEYQCFIFPKLYEISMGHVYCYKAPILWFSIILFIFILHLLYFWCIYIQRREHTHRNFIYLCLFSYSFILFSPPIPLASLLLLVQSQNMHWIAMLNFILFYVYLYTLQCMNAFLKHKVWYCM